MDDDLGRHVHLLRSIGDGLAWTMLPSHTIRALHRHPGPTASSASLHGQRDDIAFVFSVAETLLRGGLLPIWNDLTHLLRVGDIVGVSRDHTLILECKNSPLPAQVPSRGRAARQRARGEERARYLADSHIAEQDGTTRVALPAVWPDPNWGALQRAVSAAYQSPDGMGAVRLGSRDWLVALREPANPPETRVPPTRFRMLLSRARQRARIPIIGIHTDLIHEPTELVLSPLAYPVSAKAKADLLEGALLLIRMVDLALLETELLVDGTPVSIKVGDPDGLFPILATFGGTEIPLSFRHVTAILNSPVSARSMQRAILKNLKRWQLTRDLFEAEVGEIPKHLLADGDNVRYATVFRDHAGEPVVVMPASE